MSQHPLYVMFLWHMHQPYYKDVNNQEYLMPWVRLHATKDYLDMPLIASEYPGLKITFNMVPSLLEQIEDYAAGTARDTYLTLAAKRAEDLSEAEQIRLLQMFFAAHYEHMIRPFGRYHQLHEKRGWSDKPDELRRRVGMFSSADLRDLQTWFFLTWIDPYLRERNPRLKELIKKERMFSEEEKLEVLELGRQLTGRIIPTLAELWGKGQIEVATTPYFHPILPLLVDTDIARRSRPRIPLPNRRFQHPDDARLQIKSGLDYCERLFGRRPAGMWPSEGSVCPEIIPMLEDAKVCWIASDEDGLAASLGIERFTRDRHGLVDQADALYRPYLATHQGAMVAMFFRDHFLSDQIGFKYAHWAPRDAAADLIRRLEEIQFKLRGSGEPHVVSVILDGENCWEHYQGDGEPFLRALYEGLATHRQLKTVTPSEYLTLVTDHRRLENLHSGSWINRDFSIWIGHAEDNASWDLLGQAREDIAKRLASDPPVSPEARDKAMKSILTAEGSDWNWWYGDDHSSDFDAEFDALYRQHLCNAYEALGMDPPGKLFIPISAESDHGLQTHPCAFLAPKLDGRVTNYFEWFSAGHYDPRRGGDSMHQADYNVEALYFGFDPQTFYLRLDLSRAARQAYLPAGSGGELVVYLFTQQNYKIVCPLGGDSATRPPASIWREEEGHGWTRLGDFKQAVIGEIIEMGFAFEPFQIAPDQIMRFQVAVEAEGRELERCPGRAPLSTTVPNRDFEEIMWIV